MGSLMAHQKDGLEDGKPCGALYRTIDGKEHGMLDGADDGLADRKLDGGLNITLEGVLDCSLDGKELRSLDSTITGRACNSDAGFV